MSNETTPLLEGTGVPAAAAPDDPKPFRERLFDFLEGKTSAGLWYEKLIVLLIVLNVLAFIIGSLFVEEYNHEPWAQRQGGLCGDLCDALWFGNYRDNGLQVLQLGSTSILEIVTVSVFTIEYILRIWTADLEDESYRGFSGRIRYVPTFFSVVDLASTVPFYVDVFFLRDTDLAASSFLRMFRLFRMMRVEGRYDTALTMVDDVFRAQKDILGTALFVGVTTWMTVSSMYYLVERRETNMIYCGAAPDYCGDPDEINTDLCTIDNWGITDCSDAGCPASAEYPEPCYNLFNSIPMASYYALLNLFGEYPLIDQHSSAGQVVGTLTAIVAVAFFALPAGIIGNGFEDVVADRCKHEDRAIIETGGMTEGYVADNNTWRGYWYNLLHAHSSPGALNLDRFINVLIGLTALTFMIDTLTLRRHAHLLLDSFELVSVLIFTVEFGLRLYSVKEDPKYNKIGGRVLYCTTFLAMVDILSFVPFWIEISLTGRLLSPYSNTSTWSNLVKSLRLLRILRFERYTHAFTSFDDVISRNKDVLAVTAFTAFLTWVFFGALLYFTERGNPDSEMSSNYNTVPNSMWVTLLNLSGESPLAQYSLAGKVATGLLGLFATGIFGIPIGVLGCGFEQVVEEENEDDESALNSGTRTRSVLNDVGMPLEQSVYEFVNGIGGPASRWFETATYVLIFMAVAVGVWQTVEGQENSFAWVETLSVAFFTVEYLLRFVGAGADPEFATAGGNAYMARVRFIGSFYSVIDLLAIVPYYISIAMPGSWVNDYDEYLRMFRILRLLKLDKYVPSITLIDDVVRLKFNALRVAFYAAVTLWILFAAGLFLSEHKDRWNAIDPVPQYGCVENCTMVYRFENFFESMFYTGVHLTGDYPIITYSWPAKFVNFFMVIAAVGVVSIPSGLIASGFVDIVQSKSKARRGEDTRCPGGRAGDDWYEIEYRALQGVDPQPSSLGQTVDEWQVKVNLFLNGKQGVPGSAKYTTTAYWARVFMFCLIIANVAAVLTESIPRIDKAVGNEPGNFFDVFEAFSVFFFALEYILRLFCAPKNREALYSSAVYATTFFGIVDLLSTAPWFVQQLLTTFGYLDGNGDSAKIFRMFRIFRILQLEDFITAFSKLDNVFRASKDVLKATGLMATIIWVGCGALFYIFEENNPNWRECDESVPLSSDDPQSPGCYDFASTAACNDFYPGLCSQSAFIDMPNSLYYTAVFLGGEWGVIDFTLPGRMVALFLCVVGIGLYAIPIGSLFDSFGAVLGMCGDDDDEDDDDAGDENE